MNQKIKINSFPLAVLITTKKRWGGNGNKIDIIGQGFFFRIVVAILQNCEFDSTQ